MSMSSKKDLRKLEQLCMKSESAFPEQKEIPELQRLALKYPEKAMEVLALRGTTKLFDLYRQVTRIDALSNIKLSGSVEVGR